MTHLAGPDALSWCDFAEENRSWRRERGGRSVPVDPISTSDYPTAAVRPANSTLSTERMRHFGIRLPPLMKSLSNCLDRLLQPKQGEHLEGYHSCRGQRDAALPNDIGDFEAAIAGLRQADDLLSADYADAGGNSRYPDHFDSP